MRHNTRLHAGLLCACLGLLVFSGCGMTPKKNLQSESLQLEYQNLMADQKLAGYGQAAKVRARQAIDRLAQVPRGQLPLATELARKQLSNARLAAEAEWLQDQIRTQDEDYRALQLEIARAEAELARREAEKARRQYMAQSEEAQRARAEAERARQLAAANMSEAERARMEAEAAKRLAEAQAREAELAKAEARLATEEAESLRRRLESLAARRTDKGLVMTLGDFVFDSGQASIRPEAQANFGKVMEFLDAYPDRKIRIEGHTDSSGSSALNLKLSQQRAEAVKALLVENGIPAGQIEAVGMGEDFPIADNNTEAGKARNRRVEIIVLEEPFSR